MVSLRTLLLLGAAPALLYWSAPTHPMAQGSGSQHEIWRRKKRAQINTPTTHGIPGVAATPYLSFSRNAAPPSSNRQACRSDRSGATWHRARKCVVSMLAGGSAQSVDRPTERVGVAAAARVRPDIVDLASARGRYAPRNTERLSLALWALLPTNRANGMVSQSREQKPTEPGGVRGDIARGVYAVKLRPGCCCFSPAGLARGADVLASMNSVARVLHQHVPGRVVHGTPIPTHRRCTMSLWVTARPPRPLGGLFIGGASA